ncbi:MAG: 2Fe-2S iron-sulfur cluster-binding protein, partial [Cyanobacteria bacterium P01_H01_bin.15]
MPEIFTVPDKKSVNADPAQTILDAMVDGDIPITNACGGQAHCSTCRVMVLDGIDHCSAPTDAERALAKKLQLPVHVRLACQTSISGGDVYL